MTLSDAYAKLLILQYYDKPKAFNEVKMIADEFESIYDFFRSFNDAFDVDSAVGKQLDIIGKIVGINRTVPSVIPKNFFGFDDNPNMYGFGDKFDANIIVYPFANKFEPQYTDLQLSDADYRFFIKAKIAKNTVNATMSSDDNDSILDAINYLFEGKAFAIDNRNMSLSLYIDDSYDTSKVSLINQLNLLPRPQAVYYEIVVYNDDGFFGFSDNVEALGFADRFDALVEGGTMSYKLI